ncbi:hypothetical protein [Sulfurovum sp. NBC37-1]|uniref:hypothetical protein n=1 Tax=Sulfurovum sp. (strain NBC37-1) TaxID=387093 RepID=UPI0002FF42DB|nr:hypothetical protein [Sulfurovum sp. NBC37-1]
MEKKDTKKKVPCRYCKLEVDKGIKRCPHCGTHNPSMGVKRAMIWSISMIIVLYLAAFILQRFGG